MSKTRFCSRPPAQIRRRPSGRLLLPAILLALALGGIQSAQAMPTLAALLSPTAGLLTVTPAAAIPPTDLLPSIGAAAGLETPGLDMLTSLWTMQNAWLAHYEADPSLRLANWSDVFNVARLGEFVIPLRDDPSERQNILLAAQAVDNATVPPGGVFSFNTVVGERTPARGYQDGWMFDRGALVRGTGGGICLVSTGLYNAALQAGLPILERHPHSGLVTYAPPGCDASVVYGLEDMQFQNTTAAPIVIKTNIEPDRIAIRLFGPTPLPGEHIVVKPTYFETLPPQVIEKPDPTLPPGESVVAQKPRAGFEVVVERFWTERGHVLMREVVADERRAPRDKIVRVPFAPLFDLAAETVLIDSAFLRDPAPPENNSAGVQNAAP